MRSFIAARWGPPLIVIPAIVFLVLLSSHFPGTARIEFEDLGELRLNCAATLRVIAGLLLLAAITELVLKRAILARFKKYWMALGLLVVVLLAAHNRRFDLIGVAAQSIRLATPIALGALAGIVSERGGVITIGIEGMMLTGACAGYVAALLTGATAWGVPAAMLAGVCMAGLHGLMALKLRSDQIISGTVVNILAVGITGYVRRVFLLKTSLAFPGLLPLKPVPFLHAIPVLGSLFFSHQPIVYCAFAGIILTHVFLFHTRWGLRTRACGEHPLAAATLGIKVIQRRWCNVLLAGGLAGLAGAWFSLEMTGVFEDLMTNGKGFIALAAMIFGRWSPVGAATGALLFGFADALQIKLQVLGVDIPYQFLGMLPYVVTMAALAGFMRRATPPAAIGKPFPE